MDEADFPGTPRRANPFWWTEAGARNVNPNHEVGEATVARQCIGTVLDFGCGYGRMAAAIAYSRLEPLGEWYHGVDPVESRIVKARLLNPGGLFTGIDGADDVRETPAETVLARNVLLHVEDDDVAPTLWALAYAAKNRLVICEHHGRHWRGGSHFTWNRELDEYRDMLHPLGLSLLKEIQTHNPRYDANMTTSVWTRKH